VNLWVFLCAAALLSLERITYLWIWHAPEKFQRRCGESAFDGVRAPVHALRRLFYGFKVLQGAVFFGWCYIHGDGTLALLAGNAFANFVGGALIAIGQGLNFSVFYRLGTVGVFYGNRFGYQVPWNHKFPFSIVDHPQYVGALLSIWGFFLLMRFPHDDWYLLPVLETVYYFCGAYFER
jgi:hypothetical protein